MVICVDQKPQDTSKCETAEGLYEGVIHLSDQKGHCVLTKCVQVPIPSFFFNCSVSNGYNFCGHKLNGDDERSYYMSQLMMFPCIYEIIFKPVYVFSWPEDVISYHVFCAYYITVIGKKYIASFQYN